MVSEKVQHLRGKTVVITGASSGIGAEAARRFSELGATVAVVGRSAQKTEAVADRIGGRPHLADYSSLDNVRRLAAELLSVYERIDILANNAGGMFTTRTVSPDGREMTFQVNHLAPFLLTNLLLPRLTATPGGARVINTASMYYRKGRLNLADLDGFRRRYRSRQAYAASKLATVLFTGEFARRVQGTGVTASCFHPGAVATDVGRDSPVLRFAMNSSLGRAVLSTPEQGAEPLLHLATVDDPQAVNGAYFDRLKHGDIAPGQARDLELARQLWDHSAQLTGLQPRPSNTG
ncbi:SDR family NAD(P)-dependent oxidoreductase [Streptomyces arenae]|uniref:SDR family NAD(P)-dependent oxidoreductase n=1 Tax=Streptomyces arenae TaxID=29301 RepID=UPI00265B234D|nr:SDR family NAD(P)-dependent oxidoreductase [Streptomyces arenae]MCG7210098.1 SDR family NAD(P)-dependent oxidoreductase [Streptomyces arenae]